MTLAIDIGNTYTKIGVFNKGQLIHTAQFQNTSTLIIEGILTDYNIDKAIICSVKNGSEKWLGALGAKVPPYLF